MSVQTSRMLFKGSTQDQDDRALPSFDTFNPNNNFVKEAWLKTFLKKKNLLGDKKQKYAIDKKN